MRAREFIFEDFKTAKAAFVKQGAPEKDIDAAIAQYRALTAKNQFKGDEKNIDWWAKQGWEPFNTRVMQQAAVPTKTDIKKDRVAGREIVLRDDEKWTIVIPMDENAACFRGKRSDGLAKWCISVRDGHWEGYFNELFMLFIICINKQSGERWCISTTESNINQLGQVQDVWDQNNKPITPEQFTADTGLSASNIMQQAQAQKEKIDAEIKVTALTNPKWAHDYAVKYIGQRDPEVEAVLLKSQDPDLLAMYCIRILRQRWPAAETAIMKSKWFHHYQKAIKDPNWDFDKEQDEEQQQKDMVQKAEFEAKKKQEEEEIQNIINSEFYVDEPGVGWTTFNNLDNYNQFNTRVYSKYLEKWADSIHQLLLPYGL